jgi:hypothetical protein
VTADPVEECPVLIRRAQSAGRRLAATKPDVLRGLDAWLTRWPGHLSKEWPIKAMFRLVMPSSGVI